MFAGCDSGKTIESKYFSISEPRGTLFTTEEKPTDDVCGVTFYFDRDSSAYATLTVFPMQQHDTESALNTQTVGGANYTLHDMQFSTPVPLDAGSAKGWKTSMKGKMLSKECSGDIACLDIDNAYVVAISVGPEGAPVSLDKLIKSLKVNKAAVDELQADTARYVDAIAKTAQISLPMQIDETTEWNHIQVNHKFKTVFNVFMVPGPAGDYEGLDELLEEGRKDMVASLRGDNSGDLLISIPVSLGYNIGYTYMTNDDYKIVGTIVLQNSELR